MILSRRAQAIHEMYQIYQQYRNACFDLGLVVQPAPSGAYPYKDVIWRDRYRRMMGPQGRAHIPGQFGELAAVEGSVVAISEADYAVLDAASPPVRGELLRFAEDLANEDEWGEWFGFQRRQALSICGG